MRGSLESLAEQQHERLILLNAIDREVAPVEREDRRDSVALSQVHQRDVRQPRLQIGIFPQAGCHPAWSFGIEVRTSHDATIDEAEQMKRPLGRGRSSQAASASTIQVVSSGRESP